MTHIHIINYFLFSFFLGKCVKTDSVFNSVLYESSNSQWQTQFWITDLNNNWYKLNIHLTRVCSIIFTSSITFISFWKHIYILLLHIHYLYFITFISYVCHQNVIILAQYHKHNLSLIYYCYIVIWFKSYIIDYILSIKNVILLIDALCNRKINITALSLTKNITIKLLY